MRDGSVHKDNLIVFTSGEDKFIRYVLKRRDFTGLFITYLILMLLGAVLLFVCFTNVGIAARAKMSDTLGLAWISSPSLCGCASYYIRKLYRICYRLDKEPIPADSAMYECELINREGTIWYFVTRAVAVPIGAFIFLLMLRCGITGLFNIAGNDVDEYALASFSYLLGVAGGRLMGYLLDLGTSALSKSSL